MLFVHSSIAIYLSLSMYRITANINIVPVETKSNHILCRQGVVIVLVTQVCSKKQREDSAHLLVAKSHEPGNLTSKLDAMSDT